MPDAGSNIRRILLPVDLSRDSLAAVGVAFHLAAALGGEVSGLFIEDAELLMAGSLPFLREVGSSSGIARRIDHSDIEHRLSAVAHEARAKLTQTGKQMQVRSCFRVTRGDVSAEILTASGEADLVVLGKAGWSAGMLRKPGRTCLSILEKSRIPVLIVERGGSLLPPILVVHDDTEAGRRSLEFARNLSHNLKWQLVVFAAREISTGNEIIRRIQRHKPRLIVLPTSLPLARRTDQLHCPLIFVP